MGFHCLVHWKIFKVDMDKLSISDHSLIHTMAEKYNLKWHTYTDHLQNMLKEMREEFTDVTLICDDKQKIRAHRNILAGCSPVFKSIFQSEDVQNPIIFLRGINHTDMESILQFIYLGEASFVQERMFEFLQAAKSLEIAELSNAAPDSNTDDYNSTSTYESAENQIEEKIELEETFKMNQVGGRTITRSTGEDGGSFQCQECEQTFAQNKSLKRHVEALHGGIKYKCQQCPKEFTQIENQRRHVMTIHGGIKYKCQQCPKEYTQNNDLKRHIKHSHEDQMIKLM